MTDQDIRTSEQVIDKAKNDNIRFIELQFSDFHGMTKAVTVPSTKLPEAFTKGIWFDGSSIEGFARIAESDMYLMPDPKTYAVIPWENSSATAGTARLICDIYAPDGKQFPGDPRYILKRALNKAQDLGYDYMVGPEMEFFLFKRDDDGNITTKPHDSAGYFDYAPRDYAQAFRKEVSVAMESMGMEVEMLHHEVAPGQHEIDFKYGPALRQADHVLTLKTIIKSIANKHGLYASFMPKPLFGVNGSGMHVHQSLFTSKSGNNAFYDPEDPHKLSKIAKNFIAGQLKHVKSFTAITAPLVNSYKRLVPGYEAPVYITWARINRSALIRIPQYSTGREKSMRAELRCPDPSCNPYLAFAVMLASGIEGISNNLRPPGAIEEDVYSFDPEKLEKLGISTLPGSLGEAIQALKQDPIIRAALGNHICPLYIRAKTEEWNLYRIQINRWELDRYLETT